MWIALLPLSLLAGCASPGVNQPPKHAAVEEAFFDCPKCGSLSGGVFGKGLTRNFRSRTAECCVHHWERVPEQEFHRSAVERFGLR